MEKIELYKNIVIYRNLISDPSMTVQFFKKNNEWRKWFTFGEISEINAKIFKLDGFPTESEWDILCNKNKNELSPFLNNRLVSSHDLEIINAFYKSTKDYVETYNISLPNWKFNTPSICMYKTNGGASDKIAMHYHTDYQQEKADAPGDKFAITCTIYLNDEYEGGEIIFRAYDKDNPEKFTEISHKPVAGDILVFPSGEPYYHAVKLVTSGEKYFIRAFWQYEFPGTSEWLKNQERYGVEAWAEMEKERERAERSTGQFQKY
jgi:hypothetical protein